MNDAAIAAEERRRREACDSDRERLRQEKATLVDEVVRLQGQVDYLTESLFDAEARGTTMTKGPWLRKRHIRRPVDELVPPVEETKGTKTGRLSSRGPTCSDV